MGRISVKPSVFSGKNKDGDYAWMIEQPCYKDSLFIIMENVVDAMVSKVPGGGTAAIRLHSWPHCETEPRAAGIPTGYSTICGGFKNLTKDVKAIIDLSFERISVLLGTGKYTQVVYSCDDNNQQHVGTGIFKKTISTRVLEYISGQIRSLSEIDYPRVEDNGYPQCDLNEIRIKEHSYLKTALLLDVAQKLHNDNNAKSLKIESLQAEISQLRRNSLLREKAKNFQDVHLKSMDVPPKKRMKS